MFRLFHTPFRRSPTMPIFAAFGIWICLYAGLRLTRPVNADAFPFFDDKRGVAAVEKFPPASNGSAAGEETADPLEIPCKVFHFPELSMSGLGVLVADWGFRLHYPPSASALTLQGSHLGGRTRAAALMDLLRPQDYGFCHQGGIIHVLPVTFQKTRKDGGAPGSLKSSRLRAELKIKAGEPADLWVESEPLIRLRIDAQPLYGETDGGTAVSIALDGRRDSQPWFHQNLEALSPQTAGFEIRGRQNVWCLVTPKSLENQIVTLEVDFYYETNLPTE